MRSRARLLCLTLLMCCSCSGSAVETAAAAPHGGASGGSDAPAAAPRANQRVWRRSFGAAPQARVNVSRQGAGFAAEHEQLGVLWQSKVGPLADTKRSPCEVTQVLTPVPDGFDIEYVVRNPTDAPATLPRLRVPGIGLAAQAEFLHHRMGCEFQRAASKDDGALRNRGDSYPDQLYAPVLVGRDGRIAVGVSLHYPVLEYRHTVYLSWYRAPRETAWTAAFGLHGTLASGASREYAISVRFGDPDSWVHTLRPYRDWFHARYGDTPAYVQDLRPVYGENLSSQRYLGPDNPKAFKPWVRPDQPGWQRVVDWLFEAASARGYERVMIWTPSGLYREMKNNFPPQFMSEWTPSMEQSVGQLQRLRDAGIALGFWWGRSAQYADQWNDDVLEEFDPDDPAHRRAMLGEFELAVARGADEIGLDMFTRMPVWKAVPWVESMRAAAPDVRLIMEPAGCDIQHLQMPLFLNGKHVTGPHLLADYLVPGREIWVLLKGELGSTELDRRAKQAVGWGMTVCVKGGQNIVSARALQPALDQALRVPQ